MQKHCLNNYCLNRKNLYMQKTLSAKAVRKLHLPKISIPDRLLIISTLFVALFGYTGISKLLEIKKFQLAMFRSNLLRPYYAPLSYIVPITEIIVSLLLIIGVVNLMKQKYTLLKTGIYASFILMLSFTIYVIVTLIVLSKNLPCTCGGFISQMSWRQHLVFNILCTFLAAWGIYLIRKQNNLKTYNRTI